MTKAINPFDLDEDRERIARGLAPKYSTLADHGLEPGSIPDLVKPRQGHIHRLSVTAHEALQRARAAIAVLRPLEKPPSGSVSVEFLVWWFEESSKLAEKPDPGKFRPVTRIGRPQAFYGEAHMRPKHIRDQANEMLKQAGEKPVDQITAERKLR